MKSELRLTPHEILEGASVVEVWHNGVFIGTVTGANGPGIRFISKFSKKIINPVTRDLAMAANDMVLDIMVDPNGQ